MKEIKEFTTQELEAELLERHKRNQPGKINDYRNIVALRNQLLWETIKNVEYNEKKGMIRMKKNDYDILVRDWEDTTEKYKNEWKNEILNKQ